jgi:hypothetical protein
VLKELMEAWATDEEQVMDVAWVMEEELAMDEVWVFEEGQFLVRPITICP